MCTNTTVGKRQRGSKTFRNHNARCHIVHSQSHATDIALGNRRQLALSRQRARFFRCHQLRARLHLLGSCFQQRQRRRHLISIHRKRGAPIRQIHSRARQPGSTGTRAGIRPIPLLLKTGVGHRSILTAAIQLREINRLAQNIKLRQQIHQVVRGIFLALQRLQQLRISLVDAKGRVHHAHQRNRVRADFHHRIVAVGKRARDRTLEIHWLSRHVQPIILVMHHRTALVVDLIHRREQRGMQRGRFDACDGAFQLTEQRLHHGGVAGTFHVQRAGKFTFVFELFH